MSTVAVNQTMSYVDIKAIGDLANNKATPLQWAVPTLTSSAFYYYDNITVNDSGSGYVLGDILSMNDGTAGDEYLITATAGTGSIVGLKILNKGYLVDNNTGSLAVTSPCTASGGSGTGASLNFVTASKGPWLPYYFQPFCPSNQVNVNVYGFYLLDPGNGYKHGETLTFNELPGMELVVNTTGSIPTGSIITFTQTTSSLYTGSFAPVNIQKMYPTGTYSSSTHYGSASFGGFYTVNYQGGWLTELNRLRENIYWLNQAVNGAGQSAFNNNVSGPWPQFSYTNSPGYYKAYPGDVELYTTQSNPNLVFSAQSGEFTVDNTATAAGFFAQITIGGTGTYQFTGSLNTTLTFGSSVTSPNFTVVTAWPGAAAGFAYVPSSASIIYSYQGDIDPGTYTFQFTCGADTTASYGAAITLKGIDGRNNTLAELNQTFTSSSIVNGICDDSTVYKVGGSQTASYLPVGITTWQTDVVSSSFGSSSIVSTPLGYSPVLWESSDGKPGLWTGTTPAISTLNCKQPTDMPYNILVLHNVQNDYALGTYEYNPMLQGGLDPLFKAPSNSYTQSIAAEQQLEPAQWAASTYFSKNFQIQDSNYNFQIVSTAGTSNSSNPGWSTTSGSSTNDGSVVWKCLLTGSTIRPAYHRSGSLGIYPCVWTSQSSSIYKPPVSGSSELSASIFGASTQWYNTTYRDGSNITQITPGWKESNLARGWFIYSISLYRIGSNYYGQTLLPTMDGSGNINQITASVGCMRNGTFTKFGDYMTGQTYQVLWPCFQSSPLYYECSEEIQMAAVAIGNPGVGPDCESNVIQSQYLNDTVSLLNLLP
jgi:hypothetical protein